MKRSDALAPLSRDHHHALEVALRLRRATQGTADDAATRFLAFWREVGQRHFEIEEDVLLAAVAAQVPGGGGLAARVRDEHADLRARAAGLGDGERAPEALQALGQRLHDHVRFEERELFPALEAALPLAQLADLGAAVERAHG
jgi:hypothetical protein